MDIDPPKIKVSQHRQEFIVILLNTRKSASLGVLLLILPFLFLSGVVLNHYLQIEFGVFTSVYLWIGELDRNYGDQSWLNWVIRILLIFGPLLAVLVNLLSVTHLHYEKPSNELVCAFKLRWQNWLIIALCGMVFTVFALYLMVENL
jgi:hypothetical protein